MSSLLNSIAELWWSWQFAMLWQMSVLIGIIWIVDVCIRKWAHPQLRYALWMLVLIKLLIPPTWTSPASVTSHIPGLAHRAATVMERQGSSGILPESKTPSEQNNRNENKVATVMGQTEAVPQGQNTIAGDEIPNRAATVMERADTSIASLSWKTYAMLTWLAGIVVLSTWLLVRLTGLRREHITEGDALALPERFYTQLEAVAAKLDLKRLPRVILTDKVACPAVFGVLRPMLLMPAKKFATMSARDTEHVLLHELAHIKRGDLVVHAVWMLVQIVYWFNPLLWMIRRTLQNLRELCCDATVARLLRDKTCHYRETLLETARQLLAEPVDPGLGLLGLFENNNWLVTRLQWLEKNTWKNRPLRIVTIIALVAVMATCVLPMASGQKTAADAEAMAAKEISGQKVDKDFCLLLLDDCDPDFKGKDTYEDKLYLLDNEFKIKGSLSGLNICRNVGGNHALAVDEKRKTAWVAESVGDRLFHINLKTGMIIQVLGNIKASSVSIDPKTGNAWVLTSEGTIYGKELVVFNPKGKSIANYDIHGQDIVYSRKDDCFWVVGKTVLKVNKKGDVLGKIEGQIPWCAVSVDIDENNGNAWIVVRAHSQVEGSRDEIWIVNSNVEVVKKISVDEMIPFCVSVDSNNKVAWIGCIATTMRFTTEGEKLTSARQCAGISIIHGFTKDDVFVASNHADYIEHAKILNDGTTESRIADNFGKSQKRIAFVPFSDAKLKGYKETQLPEEESTNSELKTTNYKATLPNGVTVELLGVCEHPSDGKQWWSPDGKILDIVSNHRDSISDILPPESKQLEFLAVIKSPKDVNFDIETFQFGCPNSHKKIFEPDLGRTIPGHPVACGVSLLTEANTCDLQIGLWTENWTTVASGKGVVSSEGKTYSFSPISILENNRIGSTLYYHSPGQGRHLRYVVVDKQGSVHAPVHEKWSVTETQLTYYGEFENITPSDIQEFQIQERPYDWVTFKNVALRPGEETEVETQSSVSSPPASGEKAGWVVKNDSGESDAINRPQIAIEAKVFTAKVTHAQVAEQLKAAGVAVELNSMGLFASAALTDEQSSVFEKWMASLAGTSALVCPKVRVFDGEKTRMALNDTQKFTTGYEGDTPKVDEFTTGVTFEFTPTYQKQDDAIRLTLAFDKKMIIDIMKQTDDAGRETEMPGFGTKSVHTTVEIPQGKTMLVPVAGSGGMGGMGSPELKAEQIFLLIKTELETQSSVSRPQSSGENVKEIQTQIEILENCKSGEREKWFAAVKALADIGSPAVPALSDAIRKTNRPRAQSTMALTLRAIGDPQAVPALIDALEKSGFSSDYGIGDPDTELAKFIHKHQMDPSKESITLGRPVREITISLERLTGHTEGHDHFHAYDENGRRLGSYTVTPEIRDREKEHRKQVAQRWRSWWQNLQKSRAHEGGVIAGHKGSVLEFYVLPEPDKEDWAGLTPDDVAQYRGGLQTEGPWAGSIRGDSYQWALIKDDFQDNDLIVETYQGERYADRFEGRVL